MLTLDAIDNQYKLISSAVEFEGDSFVSMRTLDKSSNQDCILWANALDLALNVKNKYQVCFSLNFPNYANLMDIPEIATWLTSKEARDNYMKGMNKEFLKDSILKSDDKILNFTEFLQLTRVSPAMCLGLGSIKGNIGLGADADINILNLNIKETDLTKDFGKFKKELSNIEYVIKSGEIVKKQDKFNLKPQGSIFWANGKADTEGKDLIMSKKEEFYRKYSSMFYDSYQVSVDKNLLRKID